MKNCIYRFLNKNKEVIYVGKAKDLNKRLSTHKHLDIECYKSIEYIQYTTVKDVGMIDFIECYYIQKYKPKYNSTFNKGNKVFSINELDKKQWRYHREYKKYICTSKLENIKEEERLNKEVWLKKVNEASKNFYIGEISIK